MNIYPVNKDNFNFLYFASFRDCDCKAIQEKQRARLGNEEVDKQVSLCKLAPKKTKKLAIKDFKNIFKLSSLFPC